MAQGRTQDRDVIAREGSGGDLPPKVSQFVEAVDELKRFDRVNGGPETLVGSRAELAEARGVLEDSVRDHGRSISSLEMARSLDRLPEGRTQEIAQAWQAVQEDSGDKERDREADRDSSRTD
jgi:hypothetical protein